ncbi:fimbrial protein [Pseudomonas chlororaphis]|uniref:Type 1 fimbrial protein n=1 Tax=Pseudomonas chlororaphis subsp. aurantiaca TaxID=86192 RepID=A0AAJ0ZIZ8_9PSED|nr:fimbrial protein [Pseudomonas chlororaphis]MBU4633507.1 type 1 fimbrial protein [Pseudomonas chlororaphis subsp. aurantiaca]
MQYFHQILRDLAARLIPAIVLVVFVSISPNAAAALVQVTAFGTTLNLPNSLPTGTVVSRYTIPLSQLCSWSPCEVTAISLWPNGGSAISNGPLIQTTVSGISARLLVNGQPTTMFNIGNNKTRVNSPLEVQLVRDERPLSAGSLAGQQGGNPSYFYVCTSTDGDTTGQMCMSNKNGLAIALSATVKLINGTCSTPDQSVMLSKIVLEKFKGVGSTGDQSGTKGFNLQFNNCPPSFARVSYELSPIGGALPAIVGALPVAGGSTAKGVAIQITDTNGTPAKFNQRFALSAYNSSTGGSYTIPMNARYIQTAATITPGTISGMMSVLVDYQ